MVYLYRARYLIAAALAALLTFLLDVAVPLGFAGGVPYVLAVLVISKGTRRNLIHVIGAAGLFLTLVGYFLSPAGLPDTFVVANRVLAAVVIATTWRSAVRWHDMQFQLREALQHERARFFDQSLDLLLVGGLDGFIRRANPALIAALGYPEEELLEIPYLEHVDPEDRESTLAAISQAAQGMQVSSFRLRMKTRTGEMRWMEWNAPAILPEKDIFYASGRDITEQIEQAQAARQATQFLESTLDSLASHICILDESSRIAFVNKAWRDFAVANGAAEASAFLGVNYLETCDKAAEAGDPHARKVSQAIRKILDRELNSFGFEYACHAPDKKRWVFCRITRFEFEGKIWATVSHENITEKKLAEERQARFAEVFENTSDFVGVAGIDRRARFLNRAGRHMVGLGDLDDVSQRNISEFHPPWVLKILENEAFPTAMEHGTWSGEMALLTRDGRELPVEMVIVAHRNASGDVEYLSTVSRDLTARREVERNHQTLAAIVESSQDGIIGKDLDGIVTTWNPAAERIYGYSAEEIVGRSIQMLVPEEKFAEVDEILNRLRRGMVINPIETVRRRKDGQLIDVSLAISPLRNPTGTTIGASIIVRDITEKRRIERQIRKQELLIREAQEKLRAVLDSTAEAIYGLDREGACTFANAACVKMLGFQNEQELIGKTMHQLVHHTRLDGLPYDVENCPVQLAIRSGEKSHVVDEVLWRRNGTSFPAEYWSHPMYHEGKCVGAVVTFWDITERKQAEQRIKENEERLRHSQRMESVGALAGGVAHEFNNLLQVITGYGTFALEGLEESDPVRTDISQVLDAAHRAGVLTDQLLSFSRRQVMLCEQVDLNQLIRDLAGMLRPLLGERIQFETILPETPYHVECDPSQLHQALMNLCINARDAMPRGGRLEIRVSPVTTVGGPPNSGPDACAPHFVEIEVTDSGQGIAPEVQDRIFDPFFTTKEVGEGTGLGLAMVYGVVSEIGGSIDVESQLGRGTTFRLHLPISGETELEPDISHPFSTTNAQATILVAEDEPLVQKFLSRVLEQAGYQVVLASSGLDAWQMFQQFAGQIDVLLLDVIMPELDGVEVLEKVRHDFPHIPAVFCTGYAPNTPEVANILSQGLAVLKKPIDVATLLNAINEALASSTIVEELSK